MLKLTLSSLLVLGLSIPLALGGVEVGDAAPDFELAGSDGQTYKLSQFVGKKPVVVAWFPKAFTGG